MQVDKNKCVGCCCCMSMCPVGAIKLVEGKAEIDQNLCQKCGSCKSVCPMSAIA